MDNRKLEIERILNPDEVMLDPKTPNLAQPRVESSLSFKMIRKKKEKPRSEFDNLPDITPDLIAKMQSRWNMEGDNGKRPMCEFIAAVREHMDALNPYMEGYRNTQPSWHECWRFLYKIAQELDNAQEAAASEMFYSVPNELRLKKARARINLAKDDADWQEAKNKHWDEIEKRKEMITTLQSKIPAMMAATTLTELKIFELQKSSLETLSKPNYLSFLGSLFVRKIKLVPQAPAVIEAEVKAMKERLLNEYNNEIHFKTNSLNEFLNTKPKEPQRYRKELNAIKAMIRYDEMEYYRTQTKFVMLHAIRLYVLAFRTYYLIYSDNPLLDEQKKSDNASAKILFKHMVKGMKNNLSLFYCMQPDRCDFNRYLQNYNKIPEQEVRDAILAGKASVEMLDLVFPHFQSREEVVDMSKPEL